MDKQKIDLLKRLTNATGVAGFEQDVANIIEQELKDITRISYDKLGSIICEKQGTRDRPRIMLAAHMDEVGFMVKFITDKGLIKFSILGGWFPPRLPSQRVVIKTSKGDVPGVIGSKTHAVMSAEEKKGVVDKRDLYIDIGAKDPKDVARLGVRIGDPAVPESSFTRMANPDYLLAKAWDDRAGCAVFISVLRRTALSKSIRCRIPA